MKVAFWGQFGVRNFGNECTLYAMLAAASRRAPDIERLCVCSQPDDTATRHGITAVAITDDPDMGLRRSAGAQGGGLRRLIAEMAGWWRAIHVLWSVDLLVMTGTGMLTDDLEGFFGIPFQLLKWTTAARLTRTRVSFVSVGTERLAHPVKRRMVGASLRLAHYRSFRDPLSRQRATAVLRAASRDPVMPDLAFSLPEALRAAVPPPQQPARTVAVGIYAIDRAGDVFDRYVESIGAFIAWLIDQGHAVRIVIGDAEYDEPARARILDWLQRHGRAGAVRDEPAASFEQLIDQLGEADLVVATRFHNVQLSLFLGRPVISIAHEAKNDQLMSAMGLDDFRLSLAALELPELQERFAKLRNEAAALHERIVERVAAQRRDLEVQYSTLFEGLSHRVVAPGQPA